MAKTNVFFRVVKAERGHPFAGLYAVEKVKIKDGVIYSKEKVHEWDIRIISESILAKLGGSDAYESFVEDNEVVDALPEAHTKEDVARKAEELALTKTKLKRELKGK
jgi:hypothetical protein